MILILHRYVLRQLVATISLCWLALTLLLTLGGGVANLFRGEGFGALELAKLFILFSPVAATMVLPVAAMFGGAMTFGRMSADNEITACRAAGINIHRLFWSVFGIGVIVSAVTYYSWNFLIPTFIRQAEGLTERDIGRWAALQLQKHRALAISNYRVHADTVQVVDPDPSSPDVHEIRLGGVAFLELAHNKDVVVYGTAREATVTISQSRRQRPLVGAEFRGARTYQPPPKGQYAEAERLPVEPIEIPRTIRERLGLVSLASLLDFQQTPEHMAEIGEQVSKIRRDLMGILTCDTIQRALNSGDRQYRLTGHDATVEISCEDKADRDVQGHIVLKRPRVKLTEQRRSGAGDTTAVTTWYRAASGRIVVDERSSGFSRSALPTSGGGGARERVVAVQLNDVLQTDRPIEDKAETRLMKQVVNLPPMPVPEHVKTTVNELTAASILDVARPLPIEDPGAAARPEYLQKLAKDRTGLGRLTENRISQVICLIHFRTAVALSGLALVALAAMLGLIFRGSHVLTAFGLSCVPALFVFLAIMAGRNVGKTEATVPIGLGIMWGVFALLALGTLLVGSKGVRR